jgi:hypothetical protein
MRLFEDIYREAKEISNTFVRFGSLDRYNYQATTHKDKDSFHAAPAKRGFYAMPFKYQERFLIGSLATTQPQLFPKSVTEDPPPGLSVEEGDKWWKKYNSERKKAFERNRHEFTLKDDDVIWHHFTDHVDPGEEMKRTEYWVLTTVKSWKKALKREVATESAYVSKGKRRSMTMIDKDSFEVFVPPS